MTSACLVFCPRAAVLCGVACDRPAAAGEQRPGDDGRRRHCRDRLRTARVHRRRSGGRNGAGGAAARTIARLSRVFRRSGQNEPVVARRGRGAAARAKFTLAADTSQGTRPGFSTAAPPESGRVLFHHLLRQAKAAHPVVGSGQFGADMQVTLTNEGPVTFWLRVAPAPGGQAT